MGARLFGGPLYAPIGYQTGKRRSVQEWAWAVEAFQSIAPTLDEYEMVLSIEPVNRSETYFLNTAADAKALCEAIGHPRIGATVDTFHANIEEKDVAKTIRSLGPRLTHIHASENDRGLLGSGHVDFPAIVTALKEMHYEGYLMIEGFGYSATEPDAPGALWADMQVSPEDIAFGGARYLASLV
jgi:D-psicose/D-tagatose/L-ribulose 3-epimerase